jgi:ribonuclease BN (tRNA processing enzyme)
MAEKDRFVSVRVIFLGAGDAFNARGRCHAAYLVEASSTRFLIDCGPTTLLALKRQGLTSADVDTILVSHLHGDHFGGIPFLLLECLFETPRKGPLTVVGPPNTRGRIADLYRANYKELSAREMPFEYRCIEVQPGERTRVGEIDILPFRVPHQQAEISFGFRVEIEGKTILYSGDTGWTEELVTQSQGTDLFICECSYFDTRVCFHLDYPRLLENYRRFGCRRLLLNHTGREVHAHRKEVELEIAEDGQVVEL